MEFATVALRTLLPKLAQLLQDEYNLQKGVREGIKYLYKELEIMYAALDKVGEVPIEHLDKMQKIWARDVRDLSYDMEDIVDTFLVDVEGLDAPSKRSVKKIFKKMIKKVTKAMARREIAQDIKDIKQRVKDVAERRDRYKFDANTPANRTTVDPRITSLYTDVTELVGIDEAKKEVITRLTEGGVDQQQKSIISIAGFGGLGKTTLAKLVFDELKGQFDCKAFVSVSRSPDINKLLKGILFELHNGGDGNNFPGMNLDETKQLIDLVRESLHNKRYLIVVDDIWKIEPWKIILCALDIKNSMGSRIITTTRIIGLAEQVGGCYRLQPLTNENSKKLFYGRIFGGDKCPEQFSEVSKNILKKCGGVPLAIVTTSSLLANKSDNIKEWYYVCDSIGLGLGSNPDLDSMKKILLLSYYDLPSNLKTCLLYLSIFPEDYKIQKDRLIWRWVAEGFVQRKRDQSCLECGESYFNDLVNRSLIQPVDMDVVQGTAESCRVHDMVLDLIISLSEEECFTTTISGDGGKYSLETKMVRRLSLHDHTSDWPSMNMPKLRSLTIFKPAAVVIVPTPSLSCHLLRVLDLGGRKVKDLSSLGFLGSLSHLRYLRLSSSDKDDVDRLPEEIGKLRFLQTLDLSETKVGELPSSFTGLTQLKCLRGHVRMTRLPDGLVKNLTSLEVLECVTLTPECFAEELGLLSGLRALNVTVKLAEDRLPQQAYDLWRRYSAAFPLQHPFLSSSSTSNLGGAWGGWHGGSAAACGETMAESLGKLQKIESLSITFPYPPYPLFVMDGSVKAPLGNLRRLDIGLTKTLPTWINGASLPDLSYLDVTVLHERREDMQALGTLPRLRHLKFRALSPAEQAPERSEVGPGAFPSAISCNFQGIQGAVPTVFLGGAMPRLETYMFELDLEDSCGALVPPICSPCPYTVDDLALAHLPSLRSVTVHISGVIGFISEEVKRSVKEKLDYEKAAHPNHPRIEIRWY